MELTVEQSQRREAFIERMRSLGLIGEPGQSHNRKERPPEPPYLVHWAEVSPLFQEAGEVLKLDDVFRRHVGGYQIVMPGERAPAHRHSANAMRFVVYGNGTAYTVTNGEQMFMEPGDLLVQPTWGWHDHGNEGDELVAWRDFLDTHIVMALQPEFRENWDDGDVQPITHPEGTYSRLGLFQPGHARRAQPAAVPIVYKWGDASRALKLLAAGGEDDPFDGCLMEYRNPMSGGATVPTLSARLHLLRPGQETQAHRHTSTVRHVVVQGSGVTTVDLTDPAELRWSKNDAFTVPTWRWHRHRNSSKTDPAIIFSVTDQPAYEALGFYREETR